MEMSKFEKFLGVGVMVSCVISISLLGVIIFIDTPNYSEELGKVTETDFEGCYNLTLFETADCLNEYVRSIYNFTIQEDNRSMTLKEIIEEGGDCGNWAYLYQDLAIKRGFKSDTERIILVDNKIAHRFALIYDESGYCVLEQQNAPFCIGLDVITNELG